MNKFLLAATLIPTRTRETISRFRITFLLLFSFCLFSGDTFAQDELWGLTSRGGAEGGGTAFSLQSSGSNFTIKKNFANSPANPQGGLVQGSDGNFYGVTSSGGIENQGTIFKVGPDGSFTVIKFFDGTDGVSPRGSLIQGSDGDFYGMTSEGGNKRYSGGSGTIFKISASGSFTVLKRFNYYTDGGYPYGSLIQGSDGNFYGMTSEGGASGYGTIFKMSASGNYTVLKSFSSADGTYPRGSLVEGSDGNFYGMTNQGGAFGYGTIFKMSAAGNYTVLKSFNGADGRNPYGSLIQGSDGNFYGMTSEGGTSYIGTIFKITASGSFTVLKSFNGTDGANPMGGLVEGSEGNLYGMSSRVGAFGSGTIFKMSTSGSFTVLKSFNGTDGANPMGGLVKGSDGSFYGMTIYGGTSGNGTIFKINASGSFTVLKSFISADGAFPQGNLIAGRDGNFYGMTSQGGTFGYGTIFKMSASGSITVLKSFTRTDGTNPRGSLVEGSDGNFYGMTSEGSSSIFKISTSGNFTILKRFNIDEGGLPFGSLVEGSDGNFYGMTSHSGTYGYGTVFRISASGSFTVLKTFNVTEGAYPQGSLVKGSDGRLYGMTNQGGASGYGTIFRISGTTGFFSVLKSFNGTDGRNPYGSLIQGRDGNFYGMTSEGGASGYGTIFKMSASGNYTVLKSFSSADGAYPRGSLVESSDGNLYGMTSEGGAFGSGTIFKMSASGSFTVLKSFNFYGTDGDLPKGSIVIKPACTPPVASFSSTAAYSGAATSFTNNSTNIAENATYAWDVNDDGTVDYTTKGNISHTYPAAGTYTARLTITQGTCTHSITQQVEVYSVPVITQQPQNLTVVNGDPVAFSVVATGTGLTYQWELKLLGHPEFVAVPAFLGGNTATISYPTSLLVGNGGQVRVKITDGNGQILTSDVVTLTVTNHTLTTATLSASSLHTGQSLTVAYTKVGDYNSGNIFQAELSDATGSFASPTIMPKTGEGNGYVKVTIPAVEAGTNYRVRITSTSPRVRGSSLPLTILPNSITTASVSPPQVSTGQVMTLAYSRIGLFASANTYTAQLSDASGSFASPITLIKTLDGNGYMKVLIPSVAPGSYQVRVISSAPAVMGSSLAITVLQNTITTRAVSPASVLAGQQLTIPYLTTGLFNGSNTFQAELVNVTTNAYYPLNKTTEGNGYMKVTIPGVAAYGEYIVRVYATSPVIVGNNVLVTIMNPTVVARLSNIVNLTRENNAELTLIAYPNPVKTTEALTVRLSAPLKEAAVIQVYDMLGRELTQQQLLAGEEQATVPVKDLSKGVYQLILLNNQTKLQSKFMVE